MPDSPNHRRRIAPLLIAMMALLWPAISLLPVAARQASPLATPAIDQLAPVLPAWQDELAPVAESASGHYTIDATISLPDAGVSPPGITGTLTLDYTNTTGTGLAGLPFRLYANGPDALSEAIRLGNVTVDGTGTTTTLSDDATTATVLLPTPLASGESVTVGMSFIVAVPVNEREHYGIFNIDVESGSWALAHWYPVLAGWDPDRGWVLDPPSVNGDPIFSTTSTYDVTLTLPGDWQAVTTGIAVDEAEAGTAQGSTRRFVSGPVRDFTMVLDADFEVISQEINGTTINSWYNPGQQQAAEQVLRYATQALAYFNELIGPYPYTTLDVVPVNLFGAAGVEFPQLIYIGANYYRADRSFAVPDSLDFTVAHEVLHQWWYAMVGNNQYDHAFIDEGLTNYMSSTLYFTATYGPEIGNLMTDRTLEASFRANIEGGNDQVVDTPTDAFSSGSAYVFAAYTKAPMGFKAIHDTIGPEAFSEAVTSYFYDNWFTIADPDDLLAAFEAASGEDLDALWNHWFEEAAGRDDI